MLHIYFVCGNISPALTSLNVKNANAPPTRHQSLSLAQHSLLLFQFMAFFTFLQHERPSVFPTLIVCMCADTQVHTLPHGDAHKHICMRTYSHTFTAPKSCPNRMISKSNKTPTVFQREGVFSEQRSDKRAKKRRRGKGEEWTRGIVRPRESSP